MFDLSDKVVLITGAGQKVGYDIACVLAKFGATIIACDENKEKANRTCDAIFRCGGIGVAVCLDLSNIKAIENTLTDITEKLGHIDILIYNAGTATPLDLSSNASYAFIQSGDYARLLDIHLTGFLNCCRMVIGPMASKNWGRIIKINSSIVGCTEGVAYYSTGASGAIGFVKQLAEDTFSDGITCNAITLDWRQQKTLKSNANLSDICTTFQKGMPSNPGYLSLYLSTELASLISGQTIPLEIIY